MMFGRSVAHCAARPQTAVGVTEIDACVFSVFVEQRDPDDVDGICSQRRVFEV